MSDEVFEEMTPEAQIERLKFKMKQLTEERDELEKKLKYRASSFDELRASQQKNDEQAAVIRDLEEQLAHAKKPTLTAGVRVLTRIQREIDLPEKLEAADAALAGDRAAGYQIINVNIMLDGSHIHRVVMLERTATQEVERGLSTSAASDPLTQRAIVRADGRFRREARQPDRVILPRDELGLLSRFEKMFNEGLTPEQMKERLDAELAEKYDGGGAA